MSTPPEQSAPLVINGIAELKERVGQELGVSGWREITQEDVNAFARLTGDHQWIHVDPERAKDSPFGGTIAHGFLTLSMVAPVTQELITITDLGMGVNYGLDKVRFPAPVPVGARFRGSAQLAEVTEIKGGVQAKVVVTIEVEGSEKPAVVAESLLRFYA